MFHISLYDRYRVNKCAFYELNQCEIALTSHGLYKDLVGAVGIPSPVHIEKNGNFWPIFGTTSFYLDIIKDRYLKR